MNPLEQHQTYLRKQRRVHIYLVHVKGVEPFWTSIIPAPEVGNIIQDKVIHVNDWIALANKPYEVILNGL